MYMSTRAPANASLKLELLQPSLYVCFIITISLVLAYFPQFQFCVTYTQQHSTRLQLFYELLISTHHIELFHHQKQTKADNNNVIIVKTRGHSHQ